MHASRSGLLAAGLACALAAPATASAARVHVRVEGAKRTQLADTVVRTNARRIVGLAGHPTCKGNSALGALDAAVRGDWSGSYFDGLGYSPERIRREFHPFSGGDYYVFYINRKPASVGVCQYTPRTGDDLLFGVGGARAMGYPDVLGLRAPKHARAGHAYTAKVVAYNDAGEPRALRGAAVKVGERTLRTSRAGRVRIIAARAGTQRLQAAKAGFVRSERVTVRVRKAAR